MGARDFAAGFLVSALLGACAITANTVASGSDDDDAGGPVPHASSSTVATDAGDSGGAPRRDGGIGGIGDGAALQASRVADDSGASGPGTNEGGSLPDSGSVAPPPDTGTAPGLDPLNATARCTSKKVWTTGNNQTMRPGEACPACHSNFQLAGTVYPTGHEPNDCDGVDGISLGVTVVVTDATGQDYTLYPNQVGNFYTSIQVTPPFRAKVVVNGVERSMQTPQTTAACNGCHTPNGANGAPGRITLPD